MYSKYLKYLDQITIWQIPLHFKIIAKPHFDAGLRHVVLLMISDAGNLIYYPSSSKTVESFVNIAKTQTNVKPVALATRQLHVWFHPFF